MPYHFQCLQGTESEKPPVRYCPRYEFGSSRSERTLARPSFAAAFRSVDAALWMDKGRMPLEPVAGAHSLSQPCPLPPG